MKMLQSQLAAAATMVDTIMQIVGHGNFCRSSLQFLLFNASYAKGGIIAINGDCGSTQSG